MEQASKKKQVSNKKTALAIRKAILNRGLTTQAVANELELSPQAVYKWLNGEALPSMEHLVQLAEILDVPIDQLLIREQKEDKGEEKKKV